jgi:UPF0271 protein
MVEQGGIVSINGKCLPTSFHSICVHGDNLNAAETAKKVRHGLDAIGCTIVTLPEIDL